MKISVTILTKNSEKFLKDVLEAVQSFDEVLIYDNGSNDKTLEIAKEYSNVTVHLGAFLGFGPTHNKTAELAKNDWILSIDSDEVMTKALVDEIQKTELDPCSVYSFARHNYFNGKWIKWCGWYPDRVNRLYHRKHTHFSDNQVHEGVIIDGMQKVKFKAPVFHYPYGSISDFLNKMQHYSDLFAVQHKGEKKSSLCKALLHGGYAFFKSYFLQKGVLGGKEGFIISMYNACTAYYKYLKLNEANRV